MDRTRVDIGGATLEVNVRGHGPMTVVFENGLAMPLEEWADIATAISDRARVLCYDRRRATSAAATVPRTAMDMADDLERLLTTLRIGPPYVLVGHSWGGIVLRVFAHRHPADVAGLVFVDATHESIDSRSLAALPLVYAIMRLVSATGAGRRWLLKQLCPPTSPAAYRLRLEQRLGDSVQRAIGRQTARNESAGIPASLAHVRDVCPSLPAVPIQVLTAGGVTGPNVKSIRRTHQHWQTAVSNAAAARYTNYPNNTHNLPLEMPDVVVQATFVVLDAIAAKPGARA